VNNTGTKSGSIMK